jgi:hypothetical protein
MKTKFYLFGALILLFILIGYMVYDLYYSQANNENPYEFDIQSLRKNDTLQSPYSEIRQYKPLLTEIHGIATDQEGNIYVAGKDSVQIIDKGGRVKLIEKLEGTALCIHVDNKGQILLGMQDHVEVLNPEAKIIARWDSPGQDVVISSISSSAEAVFVADAGNKIVYRYSPQGKLLNKIGQKDPAIGVPGFILPSPYFDLQVTSEGNVWVANSGRHELELFTKEGKLLKSWGRAGMDIAGFCGCCNPSNFAILPGGSFVTSEKAIERVKIYDPEGNFVCVVAFPDVFDEGTKGIDLALGPEGEIIVLDPERNLVRIFKTVNKES